MRRANGCWCRPEDESVRRQKDKVGICFVMDFDFVEVVCNDRIKRLTEFK